MNIKLLEFDISKSKEFCLNNNIIDDDFEDNYNLFILNINKNKQVELDTYEKNLFDIDYYKIIKNNIKNLIVLNKFQLEYIKKLSSDDKNELIDIFNNTINCINVLHLCTIKITT
jgi:hypothetical protein